MKTYIKNTLLAGAVTLGMASCSENSWNDHLDGFQEGPDFSNVQTLDYTLEASDYELIASNSANKALAQTAGTSDELKAVGTLGYLNGQITPSEYIPNLLQDQGFKYFTLSEGSAINITYRIAKDLPQEMVLLNAASQYTLTEADYKSAYNAGSNFAETFCPDVPAETNLPKILSKAFPDATENTYAYVNYKNASINPVFGEEDTTPAPVAKPDPNFKETELVATAKKGDNIEVCGIVTAICARGFILTDKSGSILVYWNSGFDSTAYKLGDQVAVEGEVGVYNLGLQFDGTKATVDVYGNVGEVKYPAPVKYTGKMMDEAIKATEDFTAQYMQVTATVSISGNYVNFSADGATTAGGSIYQIPADMKAKLQSGKEYLLRGYFLSVSKSGGAPKYFNVLLTEARITSPVPTTDVSALYAYDGTSWSQAGDDIVVVQPEDYKAMGSSYGNLEGEQPQQYLPKFLAQKYPYGAEKEKYVVYKYYSNKETVLRCEQYAYEDGAWKNTISDGGVVTETNQFVYKPSGWKMDLSITLLLPRGKNQATSMWFYQAVVDWVSANVPDASSWVDSYGTAEYYSGCSAYQGNVNINSSYATLVGYYPGVEADEMVALMKKRFETETGPGALSTLYPNMAPIEGTEPTVTVSFTAWTTGGVNSEYTIIWKCVAKGKFEFVSCTWNDTPQE